MLGLTLAPNPMPRGRGGNDRATKILLHFDGADGSTSFTDSAAGASTSHSWSAGGNAQLDTAQKQFGVSSLLLDGNEDYIALPSNSDFTLGTSDFTFDFRVRFNSLSGDQSFFGQTINDSNRFICARESNGTVSLSYRNGGVVKAAYTCTPSFNTGTFYHMAFVRNGSSFYIFINGIAQSLTTHVAIGSNSLDAIAASFDIGRSLFNSAFQYLNGWIDEFRLSVGVARWTSNFTPPAAPYW